MIFLSLKENTINLHNFVVKHLKIKMEHNIQIFHNFILHKSSFVTTDSIVKFTKPNYLEFYNNAIKNLML